MHFSACLSCFIRVEGIGASFAFLESGNIGTVVVFDTAFTEQSYASRTVPDLKPGHIELYALVKTASVYAHRDFGHCPPELYLDLLFPGEFEFLPLSGHRDADSVVVGIGKVESVVKKFLKSAARDAEAGICTYIDGIHAAFEQFQRICIAAVIRPAELCGIQIQMFFQQTVCVEYEYVGIGDEVFVRIFRPCTRYTRTDNDIRLHVRNAGVPFA